MGKILKQRQVFADQLVREAVFAAVLQVFDQYGLDKLTVHRVAEAANLATGTLYNYFKDKDDLMVYTATRLFEQIRQRQQQAIAAAKSPLQKLRAFLEVSLMYFTQNRGYFQFLYRAEVYCKMDKSIKRKHVNEENQLLAAVLQEGIDHGVFKPVHPKKTAAFFQRAIIGTLFLVPALGEFNPKREASSLLKMFQVYLSPSER